MINIITSEKSSRLIITFIFVLLICFSLLTIVQPTFADGGTSLNTGAFNAKISQIGNVLNTLILCLSGLGITICGIQMYLGSDDTAQKAKKDIFLIMCALIAFCVLPHFWKMGKQIGEAISWDPNSLGSGS